MTKATFSQYLRIGAMIESGALDREMAQAIIEKRVEIIDQKEEVCPYDLSSGYLELESEFVRNEVYEPLNPSQPANASWTVEDRTALLDLTTEEVTFVILRIWPVSDVLDAVTLARKIERGELRHLTPKEFTVFTDRHLLLLPWLHLTVPSSYVPEYGQEDMLHVSLGDIGVKFEPHNERRAHPFGNIWNLFVKQG